VVPLDELWSERELVPLRAASDQAQLQAAFAHALRARFARPYEPAGARSVRRALQRIAQAAKLPRVPALAAELGISERQLRRGFDQVVGVSPKHYLRIARFQRALRVARAARHKPDWAALAEGCGYFDQAHLISEFREMTGLTPSVLVGS
jgi:AraC-like DNA-binding protein